MWISNNFTFCGVLYVHITLWFLPLDTHETFPKLPFMELMVTAAFLNVNVIYGDPGTIQEDIVEPLSVKYSKHTV